VFLKQMWALAVAAARELLWGLRAVSHEVEHWKTRASAIPDSAIRQDALDSLTRKRPNADGAALFWIVPDRRDVRLLRTLVAFETMADFLDSVNERGAVVGTANGRQLHFALVEAIDPETSVSDHYRLHPWRDDGGYLHALVDACRDGCAALSSYGSIRPSLIRAATLAQVQGLRHEFDPVRRAGALKGWAERLPSDEQELPWFELMGAASAWITVLALLTLAAQPASPTHRGAAVYAAYFPWIALTATILDSYADMVEDAALGTDSYVAHYSTQDEAARRTRELAERSTRETRVLPDGHRHAVILACMIAMYLSKTALARPSCAPPAERLPAPEAI
jgi:tetraprenyl-beta-curcumene synthase